MHTSIRTVVTAAVAVASGVLPVAAAHAAPTGHPTNDPRPVGVVGDGSHVTIDQTSVAAGRVTFRVSSTNTAGGRSNIALFRPKTGVPLEQVLSDFADEFSGDPARAALGTRRIVQDVRNDGLAVVSPGSTEVVTEFLNAGTYYLVDTANPEPGRPALTTLVVDSGPIELAEPTSPAVDATVRLTTADRFIVDGRLPARGTIKVENVSDTIHLMAILPVLPGTTDQQIQAFYDAGAVGRPPFLAPGPIGGAEVQSPGRHLRLSYDLPRGRYVLMCFVADDETGMPHVAMGMHKVVTLH